MILYGIANCDTVRKAKKLLEQQGHTVTFHDFRKEGLTPSLIQTWLNDVKYTDIINKRSTSWKALSPEQQQAVDAQDLDLVSQFPTLIKRPILATGSKLIVGFNASEYQKL